MTPEAAQPAVAQPALADPVGVRVLAEPPSVRPIIQDLVRELEQLKAEGSSQDTHPPGSIADAHRQVDNARRYLTEALGRLANRTRRRRDVERTLEVLRASLEQDASTS